MAWPYLSFSPGAGQLAPSSNTGCAREVEGACEMGWERREING